MPVLKNAKHERFAIEIAKGINPTEAYVNAGYKPGGAFASASRLLKVARICERVAEIRSTITAGVIKAEIAVRDARVLALQDRWNRMRQLMDERASDPGMAKVAGGKTGLLCRTQKGLGSGKDFEIVDEFELDAALLRELRAHEEQAARELGQWVEKQAQTDSKGKDVKNDLHSFSDEELNAYRQHLREAKAIRDRNAVPAK